MPTVETVRGPIDTADLGPTLMHEHVFVLSTEHVQNYGDGDWWDEDERVADAVTKLDELKALGIDTILDFRRGDTIDLTAFTGVDRSDISFGAGRITVENGAVDLVILFQGDRPSDSAFLFAPPPAVIVTQNADMVFV